MRETEKCEYDILHLVNKPKELQILVILPTMQHTERLKLKGILSYAREHAKSRWRLHLDLEGISLRPNKRRPFLPFDGILAYAETPEARRRILSSSRPAVLFDPSTSPGHRIHPRTPNILFINDHRAEGETAANYFLDRHFIEIHAPKLIGAASESGSEVFEVKYFDTNAYLAQSPQFYKQMAMAAGFDRIFEVGPVFRAEKSFTNKHATEFTGFDLEMSYITSFRDVMAIEAELLQAALKRVKEKYGEQIKELFGMETIVPTLPFPEMKLQDVYKELEERYGYTCDESEKNDLTTDAERLCAKLSMDKFGHEFLFVTDYGPEKRAFYHMRDEHGMPLGYDLIWRGTEITTGAQREHRYEQLRKQADEKGLGEDVKFYMDFFRYGCPPHGGFGLGVDRLTMLLLGIPIKEVMFLFRGPNRITP